MNSSAREEIIALEYELIEGIRSGNIPFLEKVLHNDLLFIAPDGSIITKAMDLASHRSGEMVVEKIEPLLEKVNVVDDTVLVVIVYDTKGIMLGNPIRGKFRYLRVWKQFADGFKVIGGSCMQIDKNRDQ